MGAFKIFSRLLELAIDPPCCVTIISQFTQLSYFYVVTIAESYEGFAAMMEE